MNLSSVLLRYSKHGGYNYRNAYQTLKSTVSKRKVLFGSTILFGAVAPSLLSESFSQYALESHSGNANAKESFQEKFGSILRWHKDQPLLYGMIGINLAVYASWKFAPQFMQRHFLCNLANIQAKRYVIIKIMHTEISINF